MVINPDSIEVEEIDELILLTGYKADAKVSVGNGFILSEDINNQKGGILYPRGTIFDDDKIKRLIRLLEMNSDWKRAATGGVKNCQSG